MKDTLNLSQKALLELVKIGIGTSKGGFDFSQLSPDDWHAVMKESCAQAVHLLSFNAAKDSVSLMPKEVYDEWSGVSIKAYMNNLRVLKAERVLSKLLESADIDHIILKGSSSAHYYPDHEKRSYGDIDFYTEPCDIARTAMLMEENGYERKEENGWHIGYAKGGSFFELHKQICGIPEGKASQRFIEYFDKAAKKSTNNVQRHLPLPEIHGAVIMLHTLHHLLGFGLGLRHLCDWGCFVNETANDRFWAESLLPLLKETGTLKFTAVITKTSAIYLGTVCPEWAESAPEELCIKVMQDIMSLGNFGRKDPEKAFGGMMLPENSEKLSGTKKIKNLWNTLITATGNSAPKLKKVPPLLWVVALVRAFVYGCRVIAGKRPSLLKASKHADARNRIFTEFELYLTEEN